MDGEGEKLGKDPLGRSKGLDSDVGGSPEQSDGKIVEFLRKISGRFHVLAMATIAACGVASCDIPADEEDKKDPDPYAENNGGGKDSDETTSPLYVKQGVVGSMSEGGIDPESFPSTLKVNTISANTEFILITGFVEPGHSEFLDVEIDDSEGREKYGETHEVSPLGDSGSFVLMVRDHHGETGDSVNVYDGSGKLVFKSVAME